MRLKESSKIFIDGYLLNKEPQGTVTYIKELYKEVASANKNASFYIAIFKDDDIIEEFAKFENIEFVFLKQKSRLIRMLFEIPQLLKVNNFDYAHFQYVIPFSRSKKCKYIVTIHDILFNEFPNYFSIWYRIKRNFLFRYSAHNADFLLTVSSYSKESIHKNYNIAKEKILITPNGVSEQYFQDYSKENAITYIYEKYKTKNYILHVSRIEPRKNQELLLSSFLNLDLHNMGFELIFIGGNTVSNTIFEAKLNSLDTFEQSKIHYFEKVNQEDLLYFYRAAQVFVFPSNAEGFGIPPIEAAALEIPVICSNVTAMGDFDFFEPYSFNPSDQTLFEKLLIQHLKSKDLGTLKKIKDEVRSRYSWKKSAQVVNSIINNIV